MRLLPASLAVAFALILGAPLSAQWESYTYSNDVYDVKVTGVRVLCASVGGLLEFDTVSETFRKLTNADGLLECPCNAVDVDGSENLWIAHATKGVTVLSPGGQTRTFTRYEGIPGDTLCSIYAMGDIVMVGTDDGVWSVDTHGDPFGGSLSYSLYLENKQIEAIFVGDSTVWYGTNEGLFGSYVSTPSDTVYHYTTADGLPGNLVTCIAESGTLWAGTKSGVAFYDAANWVRVDSGLPSSDLRDIAFQGDTLWAATAGGIAFLAGSSWNVRNTGLTSLDVTSLDSEPGSPLWCGMVRGCVGEYSGGWKCHRSPGLLSNELEGVAVESDGDVWVVYRWNGFGVSRLSGGLWQHFTRDTLSLLIGVGKDVFVDREDNVWFGLWGNGLVERTVSGQWEVFTDTNGYLPTPFVGALDVDESGNMWIASYFYSGQYGITVLSRDKSRLERYDRSNLQFIEDIAIDSTREKKKWFASHYVGLHVLDDGGTPFDQSDDVWRSYQEPELPSDEVRAVSVDKDGDVWVATTGGTARIRQGNVVEYYYSTPGGLPASYIYQMTPDWEGGMWFEHEYGVTRKNPDGTWSNYTTASGLVSDRITYLLSGLSFDTERGALLIATGGGVSRFLTGLIPHASMDSIKVYPNPFIPKEGHLRVTFSRVPDGSVLRIYTMSGELVSETERVVNGFAYWDGRNSAGEEVSSGIYFYAIGEKKRGAIALIR